MELTLAEFTFGYLAMIDNPRSGFNPTIMLEILKDMMLDTTLYGWSQIRNFYKVLASGIEMARYTWSDRPQIASIRSQYAQRPVFSGQSKQSKQYGQSNSNIKICIPFQRDECAARGDHDGLTHACQYCY